MQESRGSGPYGARLLRAAALVIGFAIAPAAQSQATLAAPASPGQIVAQAEGTRDAASGGARPSAPSASASNASGGGATPAAAPPAPAAPPATTGGAAPDSAGAATVTPGARSDADRDEPTAAGVIIDDRGIVIRKGDKRVRIGDDREYDSFEQFVEHAPWLAGLVFLTVLLVFMIPLLIIALLIWYKMRKNRLANETMLKLAERGVVAPAAAMDAVATGTAATAAPAAVPAYEQARALHRRVVWSDLRKGIILTGVGLGLCVWSMFEDGTPNGIGLIFLFVGLGYCLLWHFEDRTRESGRDGGAPPAGSA